MPGLAKGKGTQNIFDKGPGLNKEVIWSVAEPPVLLVSELTFSESLFPHNNSSGMEALPVY